MEEQQNERTDIFLDLQVDPRGYFAFLEAARWARFIGIVYAVIMVVCTLVLIFAGDNIMREMTRMNEELAGLENVLGAALIFAFVVILAVVAAVAYTLFRFATNVKSGIERQQQTIFNNGLKSLKVYFIISGIIGMLSLFFVVVGTITSLILLAKT